MIHWFNIAGEMIVVTLVSIADGTKVPIGLRLGGTENKVVVTDELADLGARGSRFERGILAVLDGSKAMRSAVAKVFAAKALVQRCTLRKRRDALVHARSDADRVRVRRARPAARHARVVTGALLVSIVAPPW